MCLLEELSIRHPTPAQEGRGSLPGLIQLISGEDIPHAPGSTARQPRPSVDNRGQGTSTLKKRDCT